MDRFELNNLTDFNFKTQVNREKCMENSYDHLGMVPFPNAIRKRQNSTNSSNRYKTGLYETKNFQNFVPNISIPNSPIHNRQKKIYQQIQDIDRYQSYPSTNLNYSGMYGYNYDQPKQAVNTSFYQSQNFRMNHINLVHEYISKARQKKSEIEDLLRSEQLKAQNSQLNIDDVGNSLRKLKKVLRLLEITSKLILGKDDNTELRASIQNHMVLSSMNSQNLENYEFELKNKESQIKRLKKLVEILSAPEKSRVDNDISQTLILKNSAFEESLLTKVFQQIGIQTQADNQSIKEEEEENLKIIEQCHEFSQQRKSLEIQNSYSFWVIVEHKQKKQELQQICSYGTNTQKSVLSFCNKVNQTFYIPQNPDFSIISSLTEKFNDHNEHLTSQSSFMRQYKSLTKLCLYTLNLCLGKIFNENSPRTAHQINKNKLKPINIKIQKFAKKFNEKYYQQGHEQYDANFCKQVRTNLEQIYQNIKLI